MSAYVVIHTSAYIRQHTYVTIRQQSLWTQMMVHDLSQYIYTYINNIRVIYIIYMYMYTIYIYM
jgi:hypothetical protein